MFQKKAVFCSAAAMLALAVACSDAPKSPASPSSTSPVSGEAAADGSTLKVTAPAAQSPVNGAQPQTLTFVASASTKQFAAANLPPLSYQVEVKTAAGTTVCTGSGAASGSTVSISPACTLDFDTNHTWRMRAVVGSAAGPWSTAATFKSPIGGYITANEIYDPLYTGKTVGGIVGPVTFTSEGARLEAQESHIRYQFSSPLTAGEFSVMIKGADEGAPGDKSKVFAMQQGDDADITTNSYRFTAELRGRNYVLPGSVSCRMITQGSNIMDCVRQQLNFDSSRWYFWKLTWNAGGSFTISIQRDSPSGPVLYSFTHAMHGGVYRPSPHNLYLGSPIGRAGPIDATLPGGIYKNLWVSARPRPAFPGE